MTTGPLAGIRIVEIASLAPAPFGCMLLADLGATVLRVERPDGGPELAAPLGPLDRGRRSVAVDLKTAAGTHAVKRLVRDADVFVEGFRPGVAERLGIGPDDLLKLNPRLIYARMTGWGQEGPLANKAGHDINYISIAGALEPLGRAGEVPHPALNLIGDFAGGGAFLALGILAAIVERERSGQGQVIDAAMVDGASTLLAFLHGMHAAGQWEGQRGTNLLDGGASFYETYETSDGKYMSVGAVEPRFYGALLQGLGLDASTGISHLDPSGWADEHERFAIAFRTKTRAEWTTIFGDLDACVTPVLSPLEAHLHPHNIARDSFIEVDGVIQPAPAPRFSRSIPATPQAIDAGGRDPKAALAAWGLSADEVSELLNTGAVR
jgi:alpha-methylacyl-CoA racemase